VLDHGRFINGPEVALFEEELSASCGGATVVACGSGTDALILVHLALGVGPGDAVFIPSFTFAATAEAPALCGATPVFVDVQPDTFSMDPSSLSDAIRVARDLGLKPSLVIPVDLFGCPADYDALTEVAQSEGLALLADAAQSLGGSVHGRPVGTLAPVSATSFFPAKPLGCYGDGGAVLTTDRALAELLRSLRQHGTGEHKYDHVRVGTNARMDTIQAAILRVKLEIFDEEMKARQEVAAYYQRILGDRVQRQRVPETHVSAWAQYTVMVDERDQIVRELDAMGIPTAVYYPLPLHLQPAYADLPRSPAGLPISEDLARRSLSLPFDPYLAPETQDRIGQAFLSGLRPDALA
jgi:dTDP-4-amino-4,6-dideoxygalactose transaminase